MIGVTADLQFQEQHKHGSIGESGLTTRLSDMLKGFRWIIDTCNKRKCSDLIIVGDIFDNRTRIDIPVIDAVCRSFHEAARTGLRIHVLVGNHDSYLRNPTINSLQSLRGSALIHETPVIMKNEKFVFIPWYDDASFYDYAIKGLTNSDGEDFAGYCLFTHAMISGLFGDVGVPIENLHPEWFDLVFLGDVHEPQFVLYQDSPDKKLETIVTYGGLPSVAESNVLYVGSPWNIDHRESGVCPGLWLFDHTKMHIEFVENTVSPRFYKISDDKIPTSIKQSDFVRIESGSSKVVERLRSAVTNVEVVSSDGVVDWKPRIEIRASDPEAEVLLRFCKYKGVPEEHLNDYVAFGMSIIEQAK